MLRKFALIVAAGSAMFFSAAYALGLGEIDVDSHLNQKFSASIPLNSISPEEAENLLVRLADSEDFNKAGIERADYLSTLNFKVVTDAKNSRIVISSKQLAREPFLSFLLDVRSNSGRVLREYTVLLDPPAYTQPAPAAPPAAVAKAPSDYYQTAEEANQSKATAPAPASAPAPVAAPTPAPPAVVSKPVAPAKPAPAASVAAPAAEASAADAASEDAAVAYGPVKAQETFWSIASKLRPNPSVTMDQMLWALYSANPQAFEGKGITGLLKGAMLKVPSLSTITVVSPAAAKEHLQALQGHRSTAPKKAAPVASVEEAAPAPKMEPAPKPAVKPVPAEKKTPEVVAPPPPVAAPAKPATPAPAAPIAKAPPATPPPAATQSPEPAAAPETATPDQPSAAPPAEVPAEPVTEAPAPVAPPKPAKRSAEPASSALADDWMAPAIAGFIVLILALLGVRLWQKKQTGKDDPVAPVLTSKASNNLQFWKRAAESAPTASAPAKFAPPPLPPQVAAKPAVAKSILDVPPPPPKASNPLWDDTGTQAAAAESSFDLTQTMDRPSAAPNKFEETSVDEFNATNQFEPDTGKAGHDANDPVSEADFHLAYGLYDEAALLLESAAEKNPGRSDIRVKLAETYFRASKPHEFDDVAQSLKPQLDDAEWQKIAIMGSQLLPDSPLYKGAAGAALDDSVDLAFDEPIDLGAAETQIFSSTAMNAAAPQPSARSNSSVLDFKLEDLEAPQVSAKPPPPAPAKGADGNTLEFNLSDFDLTPPSGKPAAKAAPEAVAEAPAAAPAAASNAVEFDLGGFDLEPRKSADGDAAALGEDINLDDFDLGELADDSHAISAGDEAGTKLDLARAYVDMGDNDMARSLLTEVLVQGSEEQKTEAQTLIQRLA